jgi:hypothetical protein
MLTLPMYPFDCSILLGNRSPFAPIKKFLIVAFETLTCEFENQTSDKQPSYARL